MHAFRFSSRRARVSLTFKFKRGLSRQHRFFVADAPVFTETTPMAVDASALTISDACVTSVGDAAYVYPLDTNQKINLYGESTSYALDDSNRVISSNRLHSYDSSVLSAELRLQDYNLDDPIQAGKHIESHKEENLDENEAVMREGRNKQGAAGAAAVAAAMLESRRAVDGIALVPGHPLPVVFPRPDDLPPPLRFIKKFGPSSGRQTSSNSSGRMSAKIGEGEANDEDGIYSEVMESGAHVEAHSFQKSYVFEVRVLDEQNKPATVKGFHHFSELSDVLPPFLLRGLTSANFGSPTLMQSAVVPLLMMGKDIVCVAPPTSGRAYAIAVRSLTVLDKVRSTQSTQTPSGHDVATPAVIVLCASREMVKRMSSAYHVLAGEDVNIQAIFTGKDEKKQNEELQNDQCEVLLATPNRLADAITKGLVKVDQVHFAAVLDANNILSDESSETALNATMNIIKNTPLPLQLSVWCSSITKEMENFTERYLTLRRTNTVIVSREAKVNANLRQVLYALKSKDERLDCVWKLYDSHAILKREQVVIFCVFKETAESVAAALTSVLEAPSSLIRFLHSGVRKRKQDEILHNFRRGDSRILVTTDAAAKKLDIPDLEHIINYDLPPTTELLSRRLLNVGRSGRMATIHTFLVPEESAVPMTAKFISVQTGKPLSPEINEFVQRIEASGSTNEWSTPLIRLNDHAGLTSRWRVRGQLDDPPTQDLKNPSIGRRRRQVLLLSKDRK